jgi:toluene monooxygenase electron transfer component
MCQGVARSDCALELGRAVKPMGPDVPAPARVDAVVRRATSLTHDVVQLDLALARPLDFEAGQFMLMSAPGIAGARAFSMVNFEPRAQQLVFVVKRKPGGRMSEWLFEGPARGSRVSLFGPLGAATFHPGLGKNVLCVAGGSGIAGMMSILSRALQDGYFARHRGDIFFGVRTPRDVFFLDELAAAAAGAGEALRVTIALSDEEVDPALSARHPGLSFDRGLVHAVAGRRMKGRFENVRAWAAGPPPMVDATLRVLLVEGKLRSHDIRYDKFS